MTPTESDDEKLAQQLAREGRSGDAGVLAHAVLRLTKDRDDWAQRHAAVTEEYALCRKLLMERVAELQQAEDRERAAVAEAVLVEKLRGFAYQQGTDSDGWFRMCNLCGEESRIPTHIEPLGQFPHSVACVLSHTASAVALLKELDGLRAKTPPRAAQAGETP